MNEPSDSKFRFRNQLSRPEFDILDNETVKALICAISDKSLPLQERDEAKNKLLLGHVRLIYLIAFEQTGGKIGINDWQSELFDSAAGYVKERLSNIADAVQNKGVSLQTAVIKRLAGWAADKIRRADRQTLKRGKGTQHVAMEGVDAPELVPSAADQEAIREETLSLIKANVFQAVTELQGLEQIVVMSRFGFNDNDELSLKEVSELLDVPLTDVHNAYRRAKDKLRNWLADLKDETN